MTRRRTVVLSVLLVCVGLLLLTIETHWAPVDHLDHRLARALYRHGRRHPGEVRFWLDVSRVLHPDVLRVLAAAAAILLWVRGKIAGAVLVVVAMAGQAVIETVAKLAVDRSRPHFDPALAHATGASFPSGHAMTALVAFGVLLLLVRRVLTLIGAGLLVVLVSYSRLALGVHFLTDIVGAWLLGAAWLLVAEPLSYALPIARRVRDQPRER